MKQYGFYRGVNLGGWMSQCDYSQERLNNFITEKDIEKIASWGLDHVRLPVDYNVLENEDGTYKPENFARIQRAYDWCRANGLNLVIDLHKTAGYSFDAGKRKRASLTAKSIRNASIACGRKSPAALAGTAIMSPLNC